VVQNVVKLWSTVTSLRSTHEYSGTQQQIYTQQRPNHFLRPWSTWFTATKSGVKYDSFFMQAIHKQDPERSTFTKKATRNISNGDEDWYQWPSAASLILSRSFRNTDISLFFPVVSFELSLATSTWSAFELSGPIFFITSVTTRALDIQGALNPKYSRMTQLRIFPVSF